VQAPHGNGARSCDPAEPNYALNFKHSRIRFQPAKANEYFSDGLAEEIINALAHIRDLKVIDPQD
jgi:hypothetical protein